MLVGTPRQQVKNDIRHRKMLVGTPGFPKTMEKNWECGYRYNKISADNDKIHGKCW